MCASPESVRVVGAQQMATDAPPRDAVLGGLKAVRMVLARRWAQATLFALAGRHSFNSGSYREQFFDGTQLRGLAGLNILLIAHQVKTARCCNTIVRLAYKRVVTKVTYEQLFELTPSFHRIEIAV